mmetsp:Transcript_5715/g.7883  ORF Transcript_5715/g.7883 Transcript_5715/m.7883 type:complete len:180 (-) Transcript_5715:36-575(-)
MFRGNGCCRSFIFRKKNKGVSKELEKIKYHEACWAKINEIEPPSSKQTANFTERRDYLRRIGELLDKGITVESLDGEAILLLFSSDRKFLFVMSRTEYESQSTVSSRKLDIQNMENKVSIDGLEVEHKKHDLHLYNNERNLNDSTITIRCQSSEDAAYLKDLLLFIPTQPPLGARTEEI